MNALVNNGALFKISIAQGDQNELNNELLFTKVHSFLAKMTNDEPLNLRPKSQEVLRQTGFETTFTDCGHRSQSRGRSAKPRTVRGSWQVESLHSRFET